MSNEEHENQRFPWLAVGSVVAYATLPYAGFWAANVGDAVDHGRIALYWAVTGAVATLPILLGVRFDGADKARRMAVVISLTLFMFFNYPLAIDLQRLIGLDDWLHPVGWAAATASLVLLALTFGRRPPVQTFIALVGTALLILPLVRLVPAVVIRDLGPDPAAATTPERAASDWSPNVYYFVPDGYGGLESVSRATGVDTSQFASGLTARGFALSPQARANYPVTYASLASTLDMEYLLAPGDIPDERDLLKRLRGQNRVVAEFRARGYSYVHAYSGMWRGSRCWGDEDLCLGGARFGETDMTLLRLTPLQSSETLRRSPLATLAAASDPLAVVEESRRSIKFGPTFVFMHLLTPHPPYIWHADCSLREHADVSMSGASDDPPRDYGDAVTCLNHRFLETVDAILSTDSDAIIVIQADHGSDFSLDWGLSGEEWLEKGVGRARLSILSAIRMPPRCDDHDVPADLTPVNTFRLVLGCIDGDQPDLLPNRSYIVRYDDQPVESLDPRSVSGVRGDDALQ